MGIRVHIPATAGAGEVRVEDANGVLICYTDEEAARELISAGFASLHSRKPQRCVRTNSKLRRADAPFNGHAGSWPSPFEQYAAKQRRKLIVGWCEELSRRQREVVKLRYWQALTFVQISRVMGITEDGVIKLHRRTLDELAGKMAAKKILRLELI